MTKLNRRHAGRFDDRRFPDKVVVPRNPGLSSGYLSQGRDVSPGASELTARSNAWSLRASALVAYVGTIVIAAAWFGVTAGVVTAVGSGVALILTLLATLVEREAGQ